MAVNLKANHFRFGRDDGNEAGHGWLGAEDANITLKPACTFLLRYKLQETGGTAIANVAPQFKYSLNGAAAVSITTSTAVVKAVTPTAFANGADCTARLTGTGTFIANNDGCTTDALSGGANNDIAASGRSETECGLWIVPTAVNEGDIITFSVTCGQTTITNDVTPQITVTKRDNDFRSDANCISVYKFEASALTVDSKGTNTLTNNNTCAADTTNFMQGSQSTSLASASSRYYSIEDGNLSSTFPLKNGTANKTISVCGWFKPVTIASQPLFTKGVSGKYSFRLYTDASSKVTLGIGYNSGNSIEASTAHATAVVAATWVHITASYQDSDKSYAIRLRDIAGGTIGTDITGTMTLDANKINVEDSPFEIGRFADTPTYYNGLIDEVAIFSDVISAAEATAMAKGQYGGTQAAFQVIAQVEYDEYVRQSVSQVLAQVEVDDVTLFTSQLLAMMEYEDVASINTSQLLVMVEYDGIRTQPLPTGGGLGGGAAANVTWEEAGADLQDETRTTSGGALAGGTAVPVRLKKPVASGGGIAGGTATLGVRITTKSTSGGGLAGGTATKTNNFIATKVPAGGAIAGGEALCSSTGLQTKTVDGIGGALGGGSSTLGVRITTKSVLGGGISGGTATKSTVVIQVVSKTAIGGAISGGVASQSVTRKKTALGGAIAGGTATKGIARKKTALGGGIAGGEGEETFIVHLPDEDEWTADNIRQIEQASRAGKSFRLRIQGSSVKAVTIIGCSIGSRSGSTGNYSAAPTRVTFNGGDHGVTIPRNGYVYTDWIKFTLTKNTRYLVHLAFAGGTNWLVTNNRGSIAAYYKMAGVNNTLTMTLVGYSTSTRETAVVSFDIVAAVRTNRVGSGGAIAGGTAIPKRMKLPAASRGGIGGGIAIWNGILSNLQSMTVEAAGGAIGGATAGTTKLSENASVGGGIAGGTDEHRVIVRDAVAGGALGGGTSGVPGRLVVAVGARGAVGGGTGDAVFTGAAQVATFAGSGGALAGGAGVVGRIEKRVSIGGAIAGGTAEPTWVNATTTVTEVAEGGAEAGGSGILGYRLATRTSIGGAVAGGAISGGSQAVSWVGTGGAVVGGTATIKRIEAPKGVGGAVVGGIGIFGVKTISRETSGGSVAGGTATIIRMNSYLGTGGAVAGGFGTEARIEDEEVDGGGVVGGAALYRITRAKVATGGAVADGAGVRARTKAFSGIGGGISGGIAGRNILQIIPGSGGVIGGGSATKVDNYRWLDYMQLSASGEWKHVHAVYIATPTGWTRGRSFEALISAAWKDVA